MSYYIGLLLPSGVLALLLWLAYRQVMRRRLPWWAASVTKGKAWITRGTVYVMVCESKYPNIRKVGVTERDKATKRKREIELTMTFAPVKFNFCLDGMPFAWATEQEAHRLLKRRWVDFGKGHPLGTEWFRCESEDELQIIIDAVCEAAFNVRMVAIAQGAWPEGKAWANPTMVDMRKGLNKAPIFTEKNSPGLKLAS